MAKRKKQKSNNDLGNTFQALLNSFLAANANASHILQLGNLGRAGGFQQVAVAEQQLAVARTTLLNFVAQNPQFSTQLAIALAGLNTGPIGK